MVATGADAIVAVLAAADPVYYQEHDDGWECALCDGVMANRSPGRRGFGRPVGAKVDTHEATCPWRMAKEHVDAEVVE